MPVSSAVIGIIAGMAAGIALFLLSLGIGLAFANPSAANAACEQQGYDAGEYRGGVVICIRREELR